MVTTDTSGRMKMFDVSRVEFRNKNLTFAQKEAQVQNPWYINAHKELISSVEIVEQRDDVFEEDSDDEQIELPEGLAPEERQPWPDLFVLTASQDKDILLHRLSNGVKIGQFAQEEPWNIYDMTPYDNVRPNYYREWLKEKKEKWVDLIVQRLQEAHQKGLISEEESKMEVKMSTRDRLKKLGINVGVSDTTSLDSFGDNLSTGAEDYNQELLDDSEEFGDFDQDDLKGKNVGFGGSRSKPKG